MVTSTPGPPVRLPARCFAAFVCVCAFLQLSPLSSAQDPLQRYPNNYKLILDNPQVAVMRVHYGPHETVGVHDHSDLPTLFVYLNDSGKVRFRIEDIPPSVLVRPPAKLGAFRYSPGRLERHSVENLSGVSSDFLRIELKQFPLEGGQAFRNDPPSSVATSQTTTEFSNDQLEVERVICAAGASCAISATPDASLLVALSQASVSSSPDVNATMSPGDIRWIDAGRQASVYAQDGPAQVLRVRIKSPRRAAPDS